MSLQILAQLTLVRGTILTLTPITQSPAPAKMGTKTQSFKDLVHSSRKVPTCTNLASWLL